MPNKTIPQLPEQTGKTDDDLLVIVDSGETTTSKIKVSTLLDGVGGGVFIAADGTNNFVNDYYSPSVINSGNTNSGIIGGTNNTISTDMISDFIILGGKNNDILMNADGNNSIILGGDGNTITSTGTEHTIIGGRTNDNGGSGGNAHSNAIIGGVGNSDFSWRGATIGSDSSSNSGRNNTVILGGSSNTITTDANLSGILGGTSNTITGDRAVVLGGQSNTASGNNVVVSGFGNTASGEYSAVIGGGANNRALQLRSVVVGGESNQVNGGQGGVVVGGVNNVVSHTYSVALGGVGLSTLQQNEAVAQKFRIASYASLDFPDDATAAANGVQLGELYHTSGAVKIRIV